MKLFEIAQYKTDVDEEKIWDLLNTHCQDALGKLPIVRGMNRFEKGYGVVHGEAGHRESANTTSMLPWLSSFFSPASSALHSGSLSK